MIDKFKGTYRATILGRLWMPQIVASIDVAEFHASSDEDAIVRAQTLESGDFSKVIDVKVFGYETCNAGYVHPSRLVKDWSSPAIEAMYFDTITDDD